MQIEAVSTLALRPFCCVGWRPDLTDQQILLSQSFRPSHINDVTRRRAGLVPGWVRGYTVLVVNLDHSSTASRR